MVSSWCTQWRYCWIIPRSHPSSSHPTQASQPRVVSSSQQRATLSSYRVCLPSRLFLLRNDFPPVSPRTWHLLILHHHVLHHVHYYYHLLECSWDAWCPGIILWCDCSRLCLPFHCWTLWSRVHWNTSRSFVLSFMDFNLSFRFGQQQPPPLQPPHVWFSCPTRVIIGTSHTHNHGHSLTGVCCRVCIAVKCLVCG